MAVKFSDFTQKANATTANVTEIVGYLSTGELNVRIVPSALDTTYTYATTNGSSPALTLTGTKTGETITDNIVTLSAAGSVLLAGSGANAISISATTYVLSATDSVVVNNNVPVLLTGLSGNDAHVDALNVVGTGTVQVSSSSGTITIAGTAVGSGTVTSIGMAVPAAFAVTPAAITTSGTFTISAAGNATQVVLGNGALGTLPTNTNTTYTVDVPTGTTSINLKGSDATDDAIVLVGGTNIGLVRDSASQITINSTGGAGGVQEVNGSAVGASVGAPLLFTNVTGPTVGISPRSYAGGSNIGYVPDGSGGVNTVFLNGAGGWTVPAVASYKWILEGDNATTVDIVNDGRVDFTGGTGITTVVTAGTPNLLTINNDGVLDVALGTLATSTGNPLTLNLASGVETITPHFFSGGANVGFVPSAAAVSGNEFLKRDGTWSLVPDDGVSTITTATPSQLALTLPGSGDGPVNINAVLAGGIINNNTGLVTSDEVYDYIATNAPGTVIDINVDVSGITALSVTPTQITSQGTFVFTTTGSVNQVIRGDGTLGANASDVTSAIPTALAAATTGTSVVLTPQLAAISGAGTAALATGAQISTYVTTGINNRIQNITDPTSAQDGATKNYVDTTFAGSGALIFQGGYAANTAAPSGAGVLKGFTYVVTVAGTGVPVNYWSPILEVGDLIIANQDAPTNASQWTEVNKNVDVASATTVGIGNVVPGSSSTVTSPYTSGTATLDVVDSTPSQKGAVIVAGTAGDVTVTYSGGTATISSLGKADQNIYSTIGVPGQTDLVAYSTTSKIDFVNGTGITMTTTTGTPNLLTVTNSDRGSSQNIFKTVEVSGQSDIVASSNTDVLTLVGAGGITLSTSGKTLTLNGSGAGYAGWTAGATAGTSDVIDSSDTLDFKAAYSNPSGITQSDTYFKTTISTAGTTKTITFAPQIGAAGVATANTLVDRDGSGNIWVTTVNGELNGTINSATTATTQSVGDNTTKVATTAFVQANAGDVNTVIITVQAVGANNYYFIDGTQQGDITILPGFTYRLDQSATTPSPGNSGHPIRLSTTSDGTHNGGTAYTTGVTYAGTPGSAGAYTQVILEQDAPKLYYYCSVHPGMGGEINSDAGSMSTWKLDGDSGPEQTVNDGELVQLLGKAGNITTEAKASRTVEVDLATVGSAQTNVPLATVSIDTFGRVTALSAGTTGTYAQSVISANTTALAGYLYVFTSSLALTLPTGAVGSSIKISNLSNTATCTLVPAAGEKIMAVAATMTLDTNYAAFELIYTDATNGWVIIGAN